MIPRLKVTAHNEPGWNYNLWKSAFHPITERLGAGYMVYNQRIVPVSFNDDRIEGYWALRRDAIVIDASAEKVIEVAGPDAEALLDRAMTRDLTRLKPGRALYALVCWEDGGLLSDGVLLRLAHDRFWYVSGCGEVQAWLTALGMGMNVRVNDPDMSVLAIQGPKALDVLAAASDQGLPEKFSYCAVADVHMGGQSVLVSRTGFTNELGFEVYARRSDDALALWDHLFRAGAPFGLRLVALDTIDIRRVEAGIRNSGSDFDATTNPYQADLGAFVDLNKADFIGKSAMVSGDRRRCVFGVRGVDAEPLTWGAVHAEGATIGWMTVGAWSPFLREGIGIARIPGGEGCVGMSIMVETRRGDLRRATLCDLPLYDQDHAIVLGKATAIP